MLEVTVTINRGAKEGQAKTYQLKEAGESKKGTYKVFAPTSETADMPAFSKVYVKANRDKANKGQQKAVTKPPPRAQEQGKIKERGLEVLIIEHKKTGDVEHLVNYEEMDSYIRTKLEPGIYFTIKARQIGEPDLTYKSPTK